MCQRWPGPKEFCHHTTVEYSCEQDCTRNIRFGRTQLLCKCSYHSERASSSLCLTLLRQHQKLVQVLEGFKLSRPFFFHTIIEFIERQLIWVSIVPLAGSVWYHMTFCRIPLKPWRRRMEGSAYTQYPITHMVHHGWTVLSTQLCPHSNCCVTIKCLII